MNPVLQKFIRRFAGLKQECIKNMYIHSGDEND